MQVTRMDREAIYGALMLAAVRKEGHMPGRPITYEEPTDPKIAPNKRGFSLEYYKDLASQIVAELRQHGPTQRRHIRAMHGLSRDQQRRAMKLAMESYGVKKRMSGGYGAPTVVDYYA